MSVTIEACLKSDYTGPLRDTIPALRELVTGNYDTLSKGQVIDGGDIIGTLAEKIERLDVSDTSETKGFEGVATSTARIRVHPYKYFKSLPQTIKIPMENETGDCCPTVLMHELPSVQLAASWDQLFFEPDIKPNLLRFVTSILLSRWFTESSKLVDALFDWIHTQTGSAPDHFFFIMIDEVESIASSRKAAASANEPADAIRIVNSLLTSLDRLKCRRNILILTTSNLLEVIDTAFLDRVDLCQHVSAPSVVATYSILLSCMQELIRCGIIILENEEALYDYKMASVFKNVRPDLPSSKLLCIVEQAKGLSGRALRRIPLLMHATSVEDESMSLSSALDAMRLVVEAEQSSARLAVVTDKEVNLTAKVLTDQHYYL
ncbi:hypothetical protein TWF191_005886 [Orbilia oligospora]|uniref:Uncharacterized protein n=1 Tax=Orbilia oligospora TaxID=2813651 RepID=A0A7C8UX77_ORBOL|nr:hypothetical protein TWF679_000436 [Orbilia oligospora]KAF3224718.1 hypothetical protein TWF191_005886 [Orbilia oligospora]